MDCKLHDRPGIAKGIQEYRYVSQLTKQIGPDFVGWQYYLVFTVCSFTNAILFFCLFPETKGVCPFSF